MSHAAPGVVLMSVRPPYVERLLDGSKTVELRRRNWRVAAGSTVLLYASGTRRELMGAVVVQGTVTGARQEIWDRFSRELSLTRKEFSTYLKGADQAVAIRVGQARSLKQPIPLAELRARHVTFTVPQSFRYVAPAELDSILNGERGELRL
jgi:predicted transcriptional regulator